MALIHEKLYQSRDLARVDFGVYIQNLASNLFVSYGVDQEDVDLIMEIDASEIVVDTAIPCGLIVNELITNSLKHAFPENMKGEIRVGFKSLRDDGYLLTVFDNGVGLPEDLDIEKTLSLGLKLVVVLVEQLGGTIKFNGTDGTAISITFNEYLEAGTELL
jgi:two-component sensor histidine kinase